MRLRAIDSSGSDVFNRTAVALAFKDRRYVTFAFDRTKSRPLGRRQRWRNPLPAEARKRCCSSTAPTARRPSGVVTIDSPAAVYEDASK